MKNLKAKHPELQVESQIAREPAPDWQKAAWERFWDKLFENSKNKPVGVF